MKKLHIILSDNEAGLTPVQPNDKGKYVAMEYNEEAMKMFTDHKLSEVVRRMEEALIKA